jgi:hypothetical protein
MSFLRLAAILGIAALVVMLPCPGFSQLIGPAGTVMRDSTVPVRNLPAGTVPVKVELRRVAETGPNIPVELHTSSASDFSLVVRGADSEAVPYGRYDVVLYDVNDKELPLHLQNPIDVEPGEVHLKSVTALNAYPEDGQYSLLLEGEGFSTIPRENRIRFDNQRLLFQCVPVSGSAKPQPGCELTLRVQASPDGRQIEVDGLPLKYYGLHQVHVVVGNKEAPETKPVTLSWVSRWLPAEIAVGVYALLVVLLYLVLRSGLTKLALSQQLRGLGSLMFIEPDTNCYSLSKLQFYLWTGAAVLGYVYLTAAKCLSQGDLTWADIPKGLPAIILASAGTAVAASAVSASKGSKGAGEVGPNFSDFITTGGIVAPERFQFLVWTLIGIGSFMMIVFLSPPISIQDLPPVPDGFLQLMGISAAGYVGGKLVRKAGPKIDSVDARIDPAANALVLSIVGGVLSQSGSFEVGDRAVTFSSIMNPADPHRPKPGAKDPTVNDPDLFQSLELTIADPDASWLAPGVDHKFTIYNPDGQKAVWHYQIAPGTNISAAVMPAAGPAAAHASVTAPGFALTDTFEYAAPTGGFVTVATKVAGGNPYVFDIGTGASAGTKLKIRVTRPAPGGQTATSNEVTV